MGFQESDAFGLKFSALRFWKSMPSFKQNLDLMQRFYGDWFVASRFDRLLEIVCFELSDAVSGFL
jgi:hypothetical protein